MPNNITVYLGPKKQGGPDSLLEPIIDFINSAQPKQKLMIAVQEIENEEIVKAIINARKRKVTVDVVIEQDYLLSKTIPEDPFSPGGDNEYNRFLFNAILRSNVDIKSDFNTHIFHQKFMVLGDSVLTGSTNFTDTGVTKNLNHVVVINDEKIAKAYRHEFREIQKGRFGKQSIRSGKPTYSLNTGVRVKALFAPDHAPEMEIMKQILKAKKRIDFAIFTFAHSSGIDEALIAAVERGVEVHGVMDRRQANQKWSATKPLKKAGVDLRIAGGKGGLGKVHHKLMVIDESVTIFGSFNYTGPANTSNDENILIVGDCDEEDGTAQVIQRDIAKMCRTEIIRIAEEHGEEVTL